MLKKFFALILLACFLCPFFPVMNASALTQSEIYDAALNSLSAYMKGRNDCDLARIAEDFDELGPYEQSQGFQLYVEVLAGVESGDFRYVKTNISLLRDNTVFTEYLKDSEDSHNFGSIDKLEYYAYGRRAEKNGDYAAAIEYYKKANDFRDSYSRRAEIRLKLYDQQYRNAVYAFNLDTYEGYVKAAELFRELAEIDYDQSAEYLRQAENMMKILKPCAHEWMEATCLQPATCRKCGEKTGSIGSHKWQNATCTNPKVCIYCGAANGKALGHNTQKATCLKPETCLRCNQTFGTVADHNWQAATTSRPETCLTCGLTRGKPLMQAGDIITFGSYEQDNYTRNGKEPIEWIILEISGGKAFLVSKYGLDVMPYNTREKDVTWEACTLRSWLNNDFLNLAFTSYEREQIVLTYVDNSRSQGYSDWNTKGGNNTQDRIFSLSYAEANRYFNVTYQNENNISSRITPTEYAKAKGAGLTLKNLLTEDYDIAGWYWLRSPGSNQRDAASVDTDGSLGSDRVTLKNSCVRPAMWIWID